MSVGEIGLKSRRPGLPGSNTHVIFNKGGVEGADPDLTFDYVNNSLNVTGNIVTFASNGGGYIGARGGFGTSVVNAAGGGVYLGTQALGNLQTIQLFTSNAAVDNGWWEINAQNTGLLEFRTANDAYGNIVRWMQVTRANANSNIGSIRIGNPNDLPLVTIYGGIDTQGKNVVTGNVTISQNLSTGNIVTPNVYTAQLSDVTLIITANALTMRTSAASNSNVALGANGVSFVSLGNTQLMSVDGNVRIANSGNLYFGGGHANTIANSHFAMQYNVAATSLDFIFLGA